MRLRTLFSVALPALLAAAPAARAQQVGDAVPSFSLTGLDGRTYSPSQYAGKVLVLYFMGYA